MDIRLFLKNEIRGSWKSLIAIATVLALSLALSISAMSLDRSIRKSSAQAADAFDLLVGAKGSSSALLLGSVFLRDEMLGLIPATVLKDAAARGGVAWMAPLAFGDRIGNSPLVGTTEEMVTLGGKRHLASGRSFRAANEAVVGAASGFRIGETLHADHGRVAGVGDTHAELEFTVVGVLPKTGTPWDRAVLVPVESVWRMHEHDKQHAHGNLDLTFGVSAGAMAQVSDKTLQALPGFSALVVKPTDFSSAYRLRNRLNKTTLTMANGQAVALSAVFSGEVLVDLFSSLDTAGHALYAVTYASLAIALIAVVLFGWMLVHLRSPGLLTLRVMGAPSRYIVSVIWALVMTVVCWGALGGLVVGESFAHLAAYWISQQTGIAMTVALSANEWIVFLTVIAAGAIAALVPAFGVWRKTSLH
ncbi:MAG: ABC transporter permease [Sutterellaceae bacterium]|nr:ABC transporter permease [Sutterellaceae bacterium]